MTTDKPKRQRKPKEGDVLAIPLGDGAYGFGQVCVGGDYAYFDLRSDTLLPIERIVASPVAFRVPTVSGSVVKGGWVILGNMPPTGLLTEDPGYRNQPAGSNQLYVIRGNQRIPATYDEVKDLEVMSVWFDHHVVQRLLDHFEGRPNLEFESTRKIKVYDPKTGQELGPDTGKEIRRGPRKLAQADANPDGCASPTKAAVKPMPATAATLAKLHDLTSTYDQFVALLRATGEKRLTLFTESVAGSIVQLKTMLAAGMDAKLGREMVKGIREGLRETPQLLVRLVPDRGAQLVQELEAKLGCKFSDY